MGKQTTNRVFTRRPQAFLENVRIILIETQFPGNVGSTARAMKTMGLTDLALVRPAPFIDVPEARNLAHGALDVLEGAHRFNTLEEAIGDLHLVVGTTNRRRIGVVPDIEPAAEAARRIAETARNYRVGVLFGREDRGLSTSDLSHCQVIATIPAAEGMPSLNLSHAVQVLSYEIFQASLGGKGALKRADLAEIAEQEALIRRLNNLLLSIGFTPFRDDADAFAKSLRRVFGRAGMERRDVRTLHMLVRTLERQIAPEGENIE